MPFVIAAGTFITGDLSVGIQSLSISLNPQIQRLYALGSLSPYDKNIISQIQINITRYSGQGGSFSVLGNTDCDDASSISLAVAAGRCGDSVEIEEQPYWITSYNYSKDAQGWGTESFSLVSKPTVEIADGVSAIMFRGTSEGQTTSNGGADTGVVFITGSDQVEGQTIEVAAGTPGIGKAFDVLFGEVDSVGGGTGKALGLEGNASVSVPYTTLYVPQQQ